MYLNMYEDKWSFSKEQTTLSHCKEQYIFSTCNLEQNYRKNLVKS